MSNGSFDPAPSLHQALRRLGSVRNRGVRSPLLRVRIPLGTPTHFLHVQGVLSALATGLPFSLTVRALCRSKTPGAFSVSLDRDFKSRKREDLARGVIPILGTACENSLEMEPT